MENPTPDPALATGEDAIGDGATGQVYPDDNGDQILTSAGDDIVPGRDRKVTWKSHLTLDLVILFDREDVLKDDKGKDVKKQFVIKAGSSDPKFYVVTDVEPNASYTYDAKLVTTDKRRRRCLNGKRASDAEKAAEETDTAIRPRIRVGNGGGFLSQL